MPFIAAACSSRRRCCWRRNRRLRTGAVCAGRAVPICSGENAVVHPWHEVVATAVDAWIYGFEQAQADGGIDDNELTVVALLLSAFGRPTAGCHMIMHPSVY